MIYLDSSVALAEILAEDARPPESLWQAPLISSRLLQYEIWNRVHARGLARSHGDSVRSLLDKVSLVEMVPLVLERALEPFPEPVRALDALHLATMTFLRAAHQVPALASYDRRLRQLAGRLEFALVF